MKQHLLRILSIILYPLIYCRRVIMEAPLLCCDATVLDFGETSRLGQSRGTSPKRTASRPAPCWVKAGE